MSDVATLMRHAAMSASYKPALLKALVRICRVSDASDISLEHLGGEFARMYWNQTVIFHLRQASSLTKEAEVIKAIRRTAETEAVRNYAELPEGARNALRKRMARILPINVLGAFHASKPPGMPALYRWSKGAEFITLPAASLNFIKRQSQALETIANYHWADFLESRNRLAPRVIQKVQRDGAQRRTSLARFLRILRDEGERECFYCETPLLGTPTVDHVIPWSFLLDDPDWDLVLACAPCNASKSDSLPDERYIEKLVRYNGERERRRSGRTGVSLFAGDADVARVYQAAISVEWPGFWSPVSARAQRGH